MDRNALLTFTLDDGLYEAPVLKSVCLLDEGADTIVGRWTQFGLEAEGASAAEVYRDLLSLLTQHVGTDPSAPRFQPLAALVRGYGRRLPAEEIISRDDTWLREALLPWTVDANHSYRVALFQDVAIQRSNGEVRVSAFGITGVGTELVDAFDVLRRAIAEACGTAESPGPRFTEISSWVVGHGHRLAAEEAATQSRSVAEVYAEHDDTLIDITPDEIDSLGATDTWLLIQFWGDTCGWCAVQAPVLAELSDEWGGRIKVRKINADRHTDTARRFEVTSVPNVVLLRAGREIHRIQGHRGKKTIARELLRYFDSDR